MRVKYFVFVVLMMSGLCSRSQNSDVPFFKEYNLGEFTRISLEGGYRVELVQGKKCRIEVEASDVDVVENLIFQNRAGELFVDKTSHFPRVGSVKLIIHFVRLEELNVQGGVKLFTDGYLDLQQFHIYAGGGAHINLKCKAEEIEFVGEGGMLVDLNGVARRLNARLSGAGHLDAGELKCREVSCKIEGVGSALVNAVDRLDARIEGLGKIRYKGDPEVMQSIDGLGVVSRD